MSSDSRHADTFSRASPGTETTGTTTTRGPRTSIDNEAQAARAVAHEHEFASGGDGPETPAPPTAPDLTRLGQAIARVRSIDRPSPFGVAQFPPLPVPR